MITKDVAAIKEIDVALGIDPHAGDVKGSVDAGSARYTPAFDNFVSIFIVASSYRHSVSSGRLWKCGAEDKLSAIQSGIAAISYCHSFCDARLAPSDMVFSLAQVIFGSTGV